MAICDVMMAERTLCPRPLLRAPRFATRRVARRSPVDVYAPMRFVMPSLALAPYAAAARVAARGTPMFMLRVRRSRVAGRMRVRVRQNAACCHRVA